MSIPSGLTNRILFYLERMDQISFCHAFKLTICPCHVCFNGSLATKTGRDRRIQQLERETDILLDLIELAKEKYH